MPSFDKFRLWLFVQKFGPSRTYSRINRILFPSFINSNCTWGEQCYQFMDFCSLKFTYIFIICFHIHFTVSDLDFDRIEFKNIHCHTFCATDHLLWVLDKLILHEVQNIDHVWMQQFPFQVFKLIEQLLLQVEHELPKSLFEHKKKSKIWLFFMIDDITLWKITCENNNFLCLYQRFKYV